METKRERKYKDRKGEEWLTKEGYFITIIEYFGTNNCTVQFNDEQKTIKYNVVYGSIKRGMVKNMNHLSMFEVGFIGNGNYSSASEGKVTKYYQTWRSMLERCYSDRWQDKHPTYKDCSVDIRWHNFQTFSKWYDENYISNYDLDKDILVKGNKVYSPETCCFVPRNVNTLFIKCNNSRGNLPIGVSKEKGKYRARANINNESVHLGYFKTPEKAFKAYKKAKEKEIKGVARVCKSLITYEVYQALINYKIEITD